MPEEICQRIEPFFYYLPEKARRLSINVIQNSPCGDAVSVENGCQRSMIPRQYGFNSALHESS